MSVRHGRSVGDTEHADADSLATELRDAEQERLYELLELESSRVALLTEQVKLMAHDRTYIELVKLTLESPYLENEIGDKDFFDSGLEFARKVLPTMNVLKKRVNSILMVLVVGLLILVGSHLVIWLGIPVSETDQVVVTFGILGGLAVTVVSILALYHVLWTMNRFGAVVSQAAMGQSAGVMRRHEELRAAIRDLIDNPTQVLGAENPGTDRNEVALGSNLRIFFDRYLH
ncbi:MAG: hypothetical protein GKR94_15060 [Gammaproteobacteria bacterium]|nr:hypothetical protein [Gammaproteobacteria bacterium]